MARPVWTGSLQFGLVNVPVRLFPAVSEKRVRFHLVHDKDGARIRERRVCSKDGADVPYEHIIRGYEISKGQLVLLTPEELEKVSAKAGRECEIEEFVDLASIDPVFFDTTYYAVPERHASKAYGLLAQALQRANKVGIARIVLRTKESLAAIRTTKSGLAVSTLHYADEVRAQDDLEGMPGKTHGFAEKELAMAEQLIGTLEREFEPKRYRDTYRDRVMELVSRKAEGEEIVRQKEPEAKAPVVDLVQALEKSLASARKHGPRPATRGEKRRRPEAARRARRRHA
jgi:DNA end-binding protein Ku